jgi:predicted DNA-binding transcriptional regulator AlpA
MTHSADPSAIRERHVRAAQRALATKQANIGPNSGRPSVIGDELLALPAVLAITSLSRSGVYRAVASGRFPPPRKIGPSRIAWRASDIAAWLSQLPPTTADAA